MFACSGGNNPPDAGGNDATMDNMGPDVISDPSNCVAPGTSSNMQGIGGYCSPGGGQCAPRICSADLAGTPAHAWFCTTPCDITTSCGAGASCLTTATGPICVPSSCGFLGLDGGLDAGTDGGTDASADAISDANDN